MSIYEKNQSLLNAAQSSRWRVVSRQDEWNDDAQTDLDENQSDESEFNPVKRERLELAGADLIVGDFLGLEEILGFCGFAG